jgi:3-hydroxy-9,10-secoandrosta-1,3,5(10)-triene-9,17-dione monooxygenase reductase component
MAGLTVSSVLVAEGEPPELLGLVGDLTELAELVQRSRRFVVHVLGAEQRELADRFAGRYPDSGFSGVELATSDWGPVLVDTPVRAYCDLSDVQPAGWSLLLRARLAAVDIGERRSDPLVHYLGRWARLSSRQDPG